MGLPQTRPPQFPPTQDDNESTITKWIVSKLVLAFTKHTSLPCWHYRIKSRLARGRVWHLCEWQAQVFGGGRTEGGRRRTSKSQKAKNSDYSDFSDQPPWIASDNSFTLMETKKPQAGSIQSPVPGNRERERKAGRVLYHGIDPS